MTTQEDALWLNIRECRQLLTTILRTRLIERQPTFICRQHAGEIAYDLQIRSDKALDYFELKRNKCWAKMRRLVCGDELSRKVELLLQEIIQFKADMERGASPKIEITSPTALPSIKMIDLAE